MEGEGLSHERGIDAKVQGQMERSVPMTLQESMDAFKKDFEGKVPKEALEVMHRTTEDLRNSGILEQTVKVGDKAPDFTLRNTKGEEVSLGDLLSKGPVVLGFYRGRW